jgi:hypothetical protein
MAEACPTRVRYPRIDPVSGSRLRDPPSGPPWGAARIESGHTYNINRPAAFHNRLGLMLARGHGICYAKAWTSSRAPMNWLKTLNG